MTLSAWTVQGSRYVLKDRWIAVRADDCVTPGGVAVAPYYVIDYPDFVHALALDGAGRVVLVRQYRHGYRGSSLELPGGLVDPADADPVAAAVRELAEETGYVGTGARLVTTLSIDPAKLGNRVHLVLVASAEQARAPSPEPAESIEVVTMPVAELVACASSGGIVNAAHIGLLMVGLQAAGRLAVGPA